MTVKHYYVECEKAELNTRNIYEDHRAALFYSQSNYGLINDVVHTGKTQRKIRMKLYT